MKTKVHHQEINATEEAVNMLTLIVQKTKYKVKQWAMENKEPLILFPCLTLFICGILLFAYLMS
jgi:hypothetical protein